MPKEKNAKSSNSTAVVWKKIFITTLIVLKWIVITGIICGFIGGGAALGYVASLVKDDPVRSKEEIMKKIQENALTGFVYFNDDTLIGQLRTEEDRMLATLDEIPQVVLDAVIAIEDDEFYKHPGIDIKALGRAVRQRLLNEPVQTGGSTITQQLARRVFLSLEREDGRKAKEIFLALRMERLMSKEQILLAYLNKVPYGNGSTGYNLYGIKAAAKGIFNITDLKQLNVAQAAFLAGLPQQPSKYSTFTSKGEFDEEGFKLAKQRQELVLSKMLEENKITEEQYREALQFDIKSSLAPPGQKAYNTYPFLMIEAERQATEVLTRQMYPDLKPGSEAYREAAKQVHAKMLHDGYKIYTTIDKKVYDAMQEIARNSENFAPDDPEKGMQQVGAVLLDNKTGAILGMIEGRDFFKEQLNHATQAYRQPGSTMKPIAAYVPAIEEGKIQPGQVIDDVPIILKDGQKGFHIPNNWDYKYHGLVTARTALNQSYNIPAIKLFVYDVGIEKAWDYAKKMGVHSITKNDYNAQTGVIGGLSGVTVLEMTNAYATIANKGVFNQAYMIRKITDAHGKIIYEHKNQPSYVFSEQTAYLMTDMLRTVITSGTGAQVKKLFQHYGEIPVVGKTGTTQEDADAWFIGYSPDVTLGVWIGYELPKYTLSKAETKRPITIWSKVMDAAATVKPELFATKEFTRPDGIVNYTVSSVSGKRPSELAKEAGYLVTDLFNKEHIPKEEDDSLVKMMVVEHEGRVYIPKDTTPPDMLQERIVLKRERSVSQILKEIEEAQKVLPSKDRKPLSYYVPLDSHLDAPTETDPRTDDGKAPEAPANVSLSRSGNQVQITFRPNTESDVVGYRLYRSINHGPFHLANGKVVLSGREPVFTDTLAKSEVNGYYLTAVDVAGKESEPSKVVYSDGSLVGIPLGGIRQGPLVSQPLLDEEGFPVRQPEAPKNPPSAPAAPRIGIRGAAVELSWKANPENEQILRYNIYYSEQETGPFKKLGSAEGGTKFRHYADNAEGYYKITAMNEAGESDFSSVVRYTAPKLNNRAEIEQQN